MTVTIGQHYQLGHGRSVGRAAERRPVLLRLSQAAVPFVDLLLLDDGNLLPIYGRAAAEV